MLRKQPVGRRRVGQAGAGAEFQPRDMQAALRIAAHIQRHVVHQQLRKTRLQQQQRAR